MTFTQLRIHLREYYLPDEDREKFARQRRNRNAANHKRRDRNRAEGRCVNDTDAGTHGKATHGCRCRKCHKVWKRSR